MVMPMMVVWVVVRPTDVQPFTNLLVVGEQAPEALANKMSLTFVVSGDCHSGIRNPEFLSTPKKTLTPRELHETQYNVILKWIFFSTSSYTDSCVDAHVKYITMSILPLFIYLLYSYY